MEYFSPKSLSEALGLISKWKEKARLVAGGTNLILDLRARAIEPQALIDISQLKNLSYIKEERKKLRIGGLTTISELASSNIIQKFAPILYEACSQLGNPLVRNRATIAGNLADASPAADTAPPLLALEAEIFTNWRNIPIDKFFVGPNKTKLKKDEIIKEIIFSKPEKNSKMGYFKLGLRNAMAISLVSVAVLIEMEGRICKTIRIGLGAVAPTPIRAYQIEGMLSGREITRELIEECGNEVLKEIQPISDIRASADYRREMTSVILKRLILKLIS